MRKTIGWIMFIAGIGGILLNIYALISGAVEASYLATNTFGCIVFIIIGWNLKKATKEQG